MLRMVIVLSLIFSSVVAHATIYTVKTSGGNFSTLQACSNTAVAGDTCEVYAGTYSGWTQSRSGTSGNRISFIAHPGDTVTLTSDAFLSNTKFITVNGFHWSITVGRAVYAVDGAGITTSDLIISNNIVVSTTSNGNECFYLFGDRNVLDGNECSGGGNDFSVLGGTNVVSRNNYFHDVNANTTGQHIDFMQEIGGGTVPTLSFSLLENNIEKNCTDTGVNCHFVIIRTGGNAADSNIIRFNYQATIDGSGISFGGVGDNVPNNRAYNNTFANGSGPGIAENGWCMSIQNATGSLFLNNICYNMAQGGFSPTVGGTAPPDNGNLAYTTGYIGVWATPYSNEATYASLRNKDPLFVNLPSDARLQVASPAINGGVALTTVASGDTGSGTTLKLTDVRFFQPGWAGTQGDWIRIGSSTTAQISSINYAASTVTLTGSVSRSVGDSVYLYKNSSGTLVPLGTTHYVGAFDSQAASDTTPPTTPSGVFISQNMEKN